jgi:hypothetical protein
MFHHIDWNRKYLDFDQRLADSRRFSNSASVQSEAWSIARGLPETWLLRMPNQASETRLRQVVQHVVGCAPKPVGSCLSRRLKPAARAERQIQFPMDRDSGGALQP